MKKMKLKKPDRGDSGNDSAHRGESEQDFESLVREEYQKLQRQYRLMEDARHAIAGAHGKLSKQGQVLKNFRDEKENLETDLANAACQKMKDQDKKTIKTILDIMEMYELKKLKLKNAIAEILEMEENVDKIVKKLVEQKLKVQKMYGEALTMARMDQLRERLENRLYHITTQFDTSVSRNAFLHDEINAMLQIRGKFYRRLMLIKKISAGIKAKMGNVVMEATQTYEQRDDWVQKTALLRERNDKDSRQHVLEIKELQRVLHFDSKLHDFMDLKNRERILIENAKERNVRKHKGKIDELNETLENYKRCFNAILKMGNTKDIATLVQCYLEQEQINYTIFKYLVDLNHEDSTLNEEITKIKMDIELEHKERETRTMTQSKHLESLGHLLRDEKTSYKEKVAEWEHANKHMEEFAQLLQIAFTDSGCANNSIVSLLGNSVGIKPQNICLCLTVLEHRLSQLVLERGRLEVQNAVELENMPLPKKPALWVTGAKPKPSGGPFKPKVMLTGRLDAEQQEEEEQEDKRTSSRPMYYPYLSTSLREKTQNDRRNSAASANASRIDFFQPESQFELDTLVNMKS